jgi:uncharacterized NAD(P)/FAD-binding protein YdhS
MMTSIAFVGAGPTTIYTLQALIDQASLPCVLTLFEQQGSVGRGTPYRPGWNDPAMLSNIASIEIPSLDQSLVDWLDGQTDDHLAQWGIERGAIDERAFYPRLVLGEYFGDQLKALLRRARERDIRVFVHTSCRVLDAIGDADGITLIFQPRQGKPFERRFDHVVMATGHQWPDEPEVRPGYFLSPWPASALATVPPTRIGIRGSSLSAIDAVVALALAHGEFVRAGEGALIYEPAPATGDFHMTMMSRKGILPEADFFHPVPYEPLSIFTPEAIEALGQAGEDGLLDRAFALFLEELGAADPDYGRKAEPERLKLEDFHDSYFAARIDADPFVWAERNLREARQNYQRRHTVPWRYAILRMHEVIELLVPRLGQADFKRFDTYFKPVFVDDYTTVPHESIERLLALHEARKLDVMPVGTAYRIDSHERETGAVVHLDGNKVHFPIFIDATGQRPLPAREFPFPSLREQGIIRDAPMPTIGGPCRGIAIDDRFHPVSDQIPEDRLFCLSLPFLLGRHPFIQGLTSSHDMGLVVGRQLAGAIERDFQRAQATEIRVGPPSQTSVRS